MDKDNRSRTLEDKVGVEPEAVGFRISIPPLTTATIAGLILGCGLTQCGIAAVVLAMFIWFFGPLLISFLWTSRAVAASTLFNLTSCASAMASGYWIHDPLRLVAPDRRVEFVTVELELVAICIACAQLSWVWSYVVRWAKKADEVA